MAISKYFGLAIIFTLTFYLFIIGLLSLKISTNTTSGEGTGKTVNFFVRKWATVESISPELKHSGVSSLQRAF